MQVFYVRKTDRIMKKIAVFCSNPVNGGTAEVFVSLCEELLSRNSTEYDIIPCVDVNNQVRAFDRLEMLERINVYSYENIFGSYQDEHGKFLKLSRKIRYISIKKKNIDEMKKFLHDFKIDSVIIHNGGYGGDDLCNQMMEAAYYAGINGERIMVFHSENCGGFLKRLRNTPYDNMINKMATKVVTVSDYTRKLIEDSSFIRDIIVIPNGIKKTGNISVHECEEKFNYEKNAVNFLRIGNFFEIKGQKYLLDAFSKAEKNTKENIKLTLIGNVYDEGYYDECLEIINRESIDEKVTIVNNIYNASEYIALFDVFIFSSVESESLPIVLLEAMSKKLPVIAFDCGGTREAVADGRDGIVVKKRDTDAMSDAIVKMAEDRRLRDTMGASAYKHYCCKFTREIMGDRYLELL